MTEIVRRLAVPVSTQVPGIDSRVPLFHLFIFRW